jgi:hypothetical protein
MAGLQRTNEHAAHRTGANPRSIWRSVLLCLLLLAWPAAPAAAQTSVSPVLECVITNGDGTYTAVYGYNNPSGSSVLVPVGSTNRFTPAPNDRSQPTVFAPGRHVGVLNVTFTGTITWVLTGRSSTASATSTPCRSQCPWNGTPSGPVALDGQFNDWRGQACITDPYADCQLSPADLTAIFFTTVANDPTACVSTPTTTASTPNLPIGWLWSGTRRAPAVRTSMWNSSTVAGARSRRSRAMPPGVIVRPRAGDASSSASRWRSSGSAPGNQCGSSSRPSKARATPTPAIPARRCNGARPMR